MSEHRARIAKIHASMDALFALPKPDAQAPVVMDQRARIAKINRELDALFATPSPPIEQDYNVLRITSYCKKVEQ
jgi:hypothetical protein